jgi:hypothetical protein
LAVIFCGDNRLEGNLGFEGTSVLDGVLFVEVRAGEAVTHAERGGCVDTSRACYGTWSRTINATEIDRALHKIEGVTWRERE